MPDVSDGPHRAELRELTRLAAQHYQETFSDGSDERLAELYDQLDTNHTGHVDFLSWSEKVGASGCELRSALAGHHSLTKQPVCQVAGNSI